MAYIYLHKLLVHGCTFIQYTTYLSSDAYSHIVPYTHSLSILVSSHMYTLIEKNAGVIFVRAHILIHTSLLTVVLFLNCNTLGQQCITLRVFINHNYYRTHAFFSPSHNNCTECECTPFLVYTYVIHSYIVLHVSLQRVFRTTKPTLAQRNFDHSN